MTEVKLDLKSLCTLYMARNEEYKRVKEICSELSQKVDEVEGYIIHALNEGGIDSVKIEGLANFGKHTRTSVKTPKTPEDREAFFNYLKAQGSFDNMVTINSNTLNSWYKEELEQAAKEGKADFNIPGLNEITTYEVLSVRK